VLQTENRLLHNGIEESHGMHVSSEMDGLYAEGGWVSAEEQLKQAVRKSVR
jgi:hypothetical protein